MKHQELYYVHIVFKNLPRESETLRSNEWYSPSFVKDAKTYGTRFSMYNKCTSPTISHAIPVTVTTLSSKSKNQQQLSSTSSFQIQNWPTLEATQKEQWQQHTRGLSRPCTTKRATRTFPSSPRLPPCIHPLHSLRNLLLPGNQHRLIIQGKAKQNM